MRYKKFTLLLLASAVFFTAFAGFRIRPAGKMASWISSALAQSSNSASNSSGNSVSNSSSNTASNSSANTSSNASTNASSNTSSNSAGAGNTVTICHEGQTLTVDMNALQAHQSHTGDTMGACVSCEAGQGKITLDASRSLVSGGGTVWSNTPLVAAVDATRGTEVSLRGAATTIINTPGTDGVLSETQAEFDASSATYTNLNQAGGLDPLTFFADPYNQLFDFARYNAAAGATGNTLSWDDFSYEVENCNPLYGIISVTVDASQGDKSLDTGCIDLKGTLVFNVINLSTPSSSSSSSNSSGNAASNSSNSGTSNSSGNTSSNSTSNSSTSNSSGNSSANSGTNSASSNSGG